VEPARDGRSPAVAVFLAATAVALGELSRNTFFWWENGQPSDLGDESETISNLVEDVSELINRASLPWGVDQYRIVVTRLGSLPSDDEGMDYDRAAATLASRPQMGFWDLSGSRWKNWKQGLGKEELVQTLRQAAPRTGEPVTVVQVAVLGHALARAMKNFGAEQPAG
jgi:hypothetical protein